MGSFLENIDWANIAVTFIQTERIRKETGQKIDNISNVLSKDIQDLMRGQEDYIQEQREIRKIEESKYRNEERVKKHRVDMFLIRNNCEQINANINSVPGIAYSKLNSLKSKLKLIEPDAFNLDELRFYTETNELINQLIGKSKKELGPQYNLVKQLESLFDKFIFLVVKIKLHNSTKVKENFKLIFNDSELNSLNQAILYSDKLIEEMLGLNNKAPYLDSPEFPIIDEVSKWQKHVLEPHHHNIFEFRCLVLLAQIDKSINVSERKFLQTQGNKIGLSPDEVDDLLQSKISVDFNDYSADVQKKASLISELYNISSADGNIDEREEKLIYMIGDKMGLTNGQIDDAIEESIEKDITERMRHAITKYTTRHHPPGFPCIMNVAGLDWRWYNSDSRFSKRTEIFLKAEMIKDRLLPGVKHRPHKAAYQDNIMDGEIPLLQVDYNDLIMIVTNKSCYIKKEYKTKIIIINLNKIKLIQAGTLNLTTTLLLRNGTKIKLPIPYKTLKKYQFIDILQTCILPITRRERYIQP